MGKSTRVQRRDIKEEPEPWQSWASTVRYLLVQLAQAAPSLALVLLAIVHR